MSELSDESLLKARLDAIAEAQRRTRVALFLSSLAAGAILAAEWNSYFSWDRQWSALVEAPKHWGRQTVLSEQIKAWLETNTVNVSLVGLRLSVSDAAVLGAIILLVFSYYLCMSLRRENHEIGSLLVSMSKRPLDERNRLLVRLRATSVLSTTGDSDAPLKSLRASAEPPKRILFGRPVLELLTFLPVVTIIVVILTDVYFAFVDISPQRYNFSAAWSELSSQYRLQLLLMDSFALLIGVLILNFCRYSSAYRRATEAVMAEFAAIKDSP